MTRRGRGIRPGSATEATLSFRRSPAVLAFWKHGQLVFQNYATRISVVAAPVAADLLDYCDRWRTTAEIVEHFDRFRPSSLRAMVRGLAAHSILWRSDRAVDRREQAMADWGTWNPAAGFFHTATKDVRYPLRPAEAERRLRQKARTMPMPDATKRYDRAPAVALPGVRRDGDLPVVLLQRRTWRDFSRAPVELPDLATLLGLTWGVQRRDTVRGQGRVVFKTSPSGGARHPIEAYVMSLRVRGLERGLYHYDADGHRLERLPGAVTPRMAERFLGGQTWFRPAAAIVLMTAVFARETWRYSSARAYRAVLIDAGHLCQTFCLVATWLNLAPFCTMALADRAIELALGIDGISESVLYAAGVGSRRPGAVSGAWPKGGAEAQRVSP